MNDYTAPRDLFVEDERGEPTGVRCATVVAADPTIANLVLSASVGDDGRSPLLWFRLADGGLVLGVFPCGDTYFSTELDPNRP